MDEFQMDGLMDGWIDGWKEKEGLTIDGLI